MMVVHILHSCIIKDVTCYVSTNLHVTSNFIWKKKSHLDVIEIHLFDNIKLYSPIEMCQ